MTPDENFILDRLQTSPQVTIVAGLSGHGFKFASVLGDLAADLATDTENLMQVDFLSLNPQSRKLS